jgi:hypothetical protein
VTAIDKDCNLAPLKIIYAHSNQWKSPR